MEISEFNCFKNLKDTPCNNIFDFKTFCLIYYENGNKYLIDDIKTKHFKIIKKYTRIKNKNCLSFLVDLYLYPKVDIKSNTTCLFLEEVIGLKNNNLFDYIDMKNFTDYCLQCLQIKNK